MVRVTLALITRFGASELFVIKEAVRFVIDTLRTAFLFFWWSVFLAMAAFSVYYSWVAVREWTSVYVSFFI